MARLPVSKIAPRHTMAGSCRRADWTTSQIRAQLAGASSAFVVSERIQRRIDALLDEADEAFVARDWPRLRDLASDAVSPDPANPDAATFLSAASRNLDGLPSPANEASPTPALPTSFVSARYRVVRLLGEGGRKRVYLAHDERLARDVAFALVRTEGLHVVSRERMLREAQHMGRIGNHPNLVTVHDTGEEDGSPYIVQEFMSGGDVASLLKGTTPPVEQTLRIAKDVARALAFIHRDNVIHRDLKPANVFLAAHGTAKVGDFGLAVAGDLLGRL
jgi:hypothetical protein